MEAKYPALLFKQQLDAFVQKIFPMLRDNVKKEITPQVGGGGGRGWVVWGGVIEGGGVQVSEG